jgi:hypothetical protein
MFGWLRRAPSSRTEQRTRVSNALADYPPYTPPAWDDGIPASAPPIHVRPPASEKRQSWVAARDPPRT